MITALKRVKALSGMREAGLVGHKFPIRDYSSSSVCTLGLLAVIDHHHHFLPEKRLKNPTPPPPPPPPE